MQDARSRLRASRLLVAGALLSGVVACTGGGGALTGSEGRDTAEAVGTTNEKAGTHGEPARTFAERADLSNERAPSSNDRAPGQAAGSSGGAASRLPDLDCSGKYECVKAGSDDKEDYRPRVLAGFCIVDDMIFEPDGRLTSTEDGQTVVGSWSGKNPVTVSTSDGTRVCTKDD